MLKIGAAILIVFSSVIFGVKKSDELKKRLNWLEGFTSSLSYIKEEIRYSYMPSTQLMTKLSKMERFDFLQIFDFCRNLLEQKKDFKIAWKSSLSKVLENVKLTNDDIFIIIGFGEGFGKSDCESQISLCERTMALINENVKQASKNYEKYSRLYKMLGLFAGIAVALLII